MKTINCATLDVLDAIPCSVEATFTKGLPTFSIVGLANNSIQESKDRVKSALLVNEFKFPPLKITINLSPSDISKSGSHFDLSIALQIALHNKKIDFEDYYIFGELGLDGTLKNSTNLFAMILSLAQQNKLSNILIPSSAKHTICAIPNINIYCVDNLMHAIEFFQSLDKSTYKVQNTLFNFPFLEINQKKYFYQQNFTLDFNEVKGQTLAKKAALIAIAGDHNILFEGSPGCGKSMITKRMQEIMPPMELSEILEKAKLDSLENIEPNFNPKRVFRSPHHTGTKASIFGGGSQKAKIGEVALAHNGLLFFDELPHFSKSILEALREPLEDHKILISRVNSKTTYPTKFMFVAAQNPCPCGNLLSVKKECRCSDLEIQRYKNRLSDPFLDRIDLHVVMNEVMASDTASVTSKQMQQSVLDIFTLQMQRGQSQLNGKLNDQQIQQFCILESGAQDILDKAIESYALSFRGINKVLKVARTIADLEHLDKINSASILEALSFRKR
ncbi:MAG: YifB family Mg chelatase-like AAA ATPase [Campylobacterota bacterium]|nr:YifB family Mg chelatase-like AAA ATPase [Campylobacterota bacterium]